MDIHTLRLWSQIFLWVSILLPVLAAIAVGARYYFEQRINRIASDQAKAEIAELQERLRPRALTVQQSDVFLKVLSSSPRGIVDLESPADDAEAGAFASQIADLLNRSGWKINFVRAQYHNAVNPRGVHISIFADEQRPIATALVAAFEAIGVTVKLTSSRNVSPPPVLIRVGSKP